MEAIIIGTQSTDTKSKQSSLEQVLARLEKSPALSDVPNESKFRLMSNCCSLMKDANPKVAQLALDAVEICINNSFQVFQPQANITFDLLISKFGDLKLPTRTRSSEVMISLINAMGLSTGLEKLLPHLSHRVWRVREQVLHALQRIVAIYGDDVIIAADMPRQLSALLADPQSSVRQLAMAVLCDLHKTFGDSMISDLETAGVRPSQLKLIVQGIDAQQQGRPSEISAFVPADMPPPPEPSASIRTPRMLSSTSRPRASSRGPVSSAVPALTRAVSDPSVDQTSKPSQQSSRTSASGFGRAGLGATAPIRPFHTDSVDSPKEFHSGAAGQVGRKYSPDYFLSILGDGPSLPRNGVVLYTDRDLATECASILEGLQRPSDHWEDRLAALARLQALACMDAADFDSFSSLLKGMHEQISVQVTDLRSTVSKEGCRTVAVLASRMGNAFAPFAELWFPTLLKVVTVKISVISSAADRAARTLLYSMVGGAGRVVPQLLEYCAAKNPIVRKFGFEYSCLAYARWKPECVDKHISATGKVLATGIADADPGVRKGARLLYWVLHARGGPWKSAMITLLADVDISAQRHIRAEAETSAEELADLFRKPDTVFPLDNYYTCGSGNSNAVGLSAVPVAEVLIRPPPPLERKQQAENSALTPSQPATASGPDRLRVTLESAAPASAPTMGLPKRVTSVAAPIVRSSSEVEEAVPTMSLAAAREIRENRTGSRRLSVATYSAGTLSVEKERQDAPSSSGLGGSRRMSLAPVPSRAAREVDRDTSALTNGPKRIMRLNGSQKAPLEIVQPEVPTIAPTVSVIYDCDTSPASESLELYVDEEDAGTDDAISIDLNVADEPELATRPSSLQELRVMTADAQWDVRLRALLEIRLRVAQALPACYHKDGVFVGAAGAKKLRKTDSAPGRPLSAEYVEGVMDMVVARTGDPHNRVAMAAMESLFLLVYPSELTAEEMAGRRPADCRPGSGGLFIAPLLDATSAVAKLGYTMPTLFARLGDRRSKVRDRANDILINVKTSYDPNLLIAALSPRLCEVPDKVRTAVTQFLLTIAALCEPYFRNPSHTHQFLSRMAHLLGSGGAMTPSTAFQLTGKRLLELVYKTAPQVMLAQTAGLPLQEQATIKKCLSGVVSNIDAAVAAASKVEWNRVASHESNSRNAHSVHQNKSTLSSIPVATMDISLDSYSIHMLAETSDNIKAEATRMAVLQSPVVNSPTRMSADKEDSYDFSESSMYAPFEAELNVDTDIIVPADVVSGAKESPQWAQPLCSPEPSKAPGTPGAATASISPVFVSLLSPNQSDRDIVWLLRTLSNTDFMVQSDERKDALTELKTLIKGGTDAFWTRNFAQIISVLLDAFTPLTANERAVSSLAATAGDDYAYISQSSGAITGLSPPGRSMELDQDMSTSKANSKGKGVSTFHRENLSASEINHGSKSSLEEAGGGAEVQLLRMEFLHDVSRAVLLIVRHRGPNVTNFLELMTCRLCEAAAFLPLALTMQCEQILGSACHLGAQGMAKALAPYCSYGSGSVTLAAQENSALPPPPDPSFATSPSSSVRRLALRVLALCVPHMTSRQLVSILPLLMAHALPSFRSPLVDIRQAVVGAIVQMYVLVGDVLHPYVKELPPQQKKLLTIYIDRQLKSTGSKKTTQGMT